MNRKNLSDEQNPLLQYGHWIWDSTNNFLVGSEGINEIFGLTDKEKLTLEILRKYIPVYDQDKLVLAINRLFETGSTQSILCKTIVNEEIRRLFIKINQEQYDGKTKIYGTLQDVSEIYDHELKEFERKASIEFDAKIRHEGNNGLYQQQLELIRHIANAIPDIIFVFDIERHFEVFSNGDIFKQLGYSNVGNKAMLLREILHHDDKLVFGDLTEKLTNKEKEYVDLEFRCKDSEGKWRWIWLRSKIFKLNKNGLPSQIIGVVRDVTFRKTDEQQVLQMNEQLEKLVREQTKELIEREERYQLANKVTHDAIWDLDLANETITFNDNYFTVFGYESANFKGKISDCYRFIHPEDIERVKTSLQKKIQDGATYWQENYRYRRIDGSYAFVLDRAIIKYETGKAIRIVGAMADISKEKQAQDELKSLADELNLVLETIPAMAWTAHPDGYRNYYNQRWYDYTGQSKEEANGWGWENVHHPDDLHKTKERLKYSIETGQEYIRENRIKRFDGDFRWHLVRARALKNDKNEVIRWVGTSTDIHDLKIAEKEKEEALAIANEKAIELTQLNEHMDNFVHMAAHDLRSPLSNLMLTTDVIKRTTEVDKKVALIGTFEKSLDKLNRTIEVMVDFIRIQNESGRMIKNLRFDEALMLVMDDYQHQFGKCEGKLKYNFVGCPVITYVEVYLLSILKNLIGNAIKYRHEERPLILEIGSQKEGGYVKLSVQDNGMGMDLDRIGDQIFMPFKRFTSKGEGKGMGLNMIKNIIEKNNGYIEVQSTPDEGSTFLCYLREYI